MSSTSAICSGTGKEQEMEVTLTNVVCWLATIEAIVRPLQPLVDQFPALQTCLKSSSRSR
jgi:hypothetical protein